MTKILPSTFQYFDKHYSVIDDRRMAVAIMRHASIPFTILADMIVGIANLIFLGIKKELSEELFWEVTHQQLFEYPYQQLIYLIFASIGTVMHKDNAKGYELGQWAVMNLSFEAYGGRPVIFEHMISHYESPQYFPNIALNGDDRRNLDQFVEVFCRFRHYQKQLDKDSPIKKEGPLYQYFYDKPPSHIRDLESIYLRKVDELEGCYEKKALNEAKKALETFFAFPLVLRIHLLRPPH